MNAGKAPEFLSFEFHARFFPALLWSRLRPRERSGTGFAPGMEFLIAFFFFCILVVIGIPYGMTHRSILGWAAGGIGAAGILALFVRSIASREGPPVYDDFLFGVFFFFVVLGLTAGIFVGTLEHSFPLGLLAGMGGLIAGYLLGILAGLWFQYLGWIASLVNGLAALGVIGMVLVDLVLLSGAIFG